jgi:hypothetical protein
MKEKEMKKIMLWIIILTLIFAGSTFAEKKKKGGFRFLSPGDIYFYTMGTVVNINPYDVYESYGREREFSLLVGAGFPMFIFYDRYKLNFEFDFVKPSYDILADDIMDTQSVQFLNFTLNFEYLLRNKKVSFYGGLGLTSIKYLENTIFYKETYTAMLIDMGFKVRMTRNISFRGEFRYYVEPGDSEYDAYYDEYYSTSDPIGLGTLIGIGLEINF